MVLHGRLSTKYCGLKVSTQPRSCNRYRVTAVESFWREIGAVYDVNYTTSVDMSAIMPGSTQETLIYRAEKGNARHVERYQNILPCCLGMWSTMKTETVLTIPFIISGCLPLSQIISVTTEGWTLPPFGVA